MDWFLYDKDLRHEGYTSVQFSHEVKHPSIALVHKKKENVVKLTLGQYNHSCKPFFIIGMDNV